MALIKKDDVPPSLQEVAGDIPEFVADVLFHKVEAHTSATSGKTSWKIEMEILSPEAVTVGDKEITMQGRKMRGYAPLANEDWGVGAIINGLEVGGFDFSKFGPEAADAKAIDTDLPEVVDGWIARMWVKAELREAWNKVEQKPYLDPEGKPVVVGANMVARDMNPFKSIQGPSQLNLAAAY